MMIKPNTIIHGDCLEIMGEIPDSSIDLIITSPPYNMNLRVRNGKHCSRQIVKEISTKYEGFPDNLTMEEYFTFNKNCINEMLRISKLTFWNIQILTGNKSAIYKLMGEFADYIKEIIVWDKVNAQPAIHEGNLNSQFELILIFSKNDAITRSFKDVNFTKGTLSNVWKIKRDPKKVKCHGAVFPIELVDNIILNFSKEKDLILDPFIGTGTVALSCIKNNRNYIGIEKLEKYYDIAVERITNG
jgi:site-specific DNA-methyltransferase (adenine-specific)